MPPKNRLFHPVGTEDSFSERRDEDEPVVRRPSQEPESLGKFTGGSGCHRRGDKRLLAHKKGRRVAVAVEELLESPRIARAEPVSSIASPPPGTRTWKGRGNCQGSLAWNRCRLQTSCTFAAGERAVMTAISTTWIAVKAFRGRVPLVEYPSEFGEFAACWEGVFFVRSEREKPDRKFGKWRGITYANGQFTARKLEDVWARPSTARTTNQPTPR